MRLWIAGRDGDGALMGWPDDGGIAQQAAWIFDAYGVLAGVEAQMRKVEKEGAA